MKNQVKCYRCGKIYDLKASQVREIISCDHCHQKMKISAKTEKRFRIMRYLVIFLFCLLLAFLMNILSVSNYFAIIIILFLALLLADYADHACLLLTDFFFGLEYEEYHEVKKTKKEIRKEREAKEKKKN